MAEVASRTPRVKLTPPKRPSRFFQRPALDSRLDGAVEHRITAVVAGAGFGKSMQLAANAAASDWCWYAADAADAAGPVFARGLGDALRRRLPELLELVIPTATTLNETAAAESLGLAIEEGLSDDVVLVVDDVHELGRDSPGVRLLEALVRFAPPELHLVFASRDELPFSIARLRAQGTVLDFDASDLAFGADEVDAAVVAALGEKSAPLAGSLYEATSGWPVAVQLGIEWLASVPQTDRTEALAALATRKTPLMSYLADEIFGSEPPHVRELLSALVHFDRVTPGLCMACGIVEADATLEDLARRGLLEEADGTYTPHALIRQFVAAAWPLSPDAVRALRRRAGAWYEANHDPVSAARVYTAARDRDGVRRVFEESWNVLDNAAAVDTILEGAALLSPEERETTPGLIAHALIVRGEIEEARRWIARVRDQDPIFGFLEGLAHMHRFEHREAVEKFLLAREEKGREDYYASAFAAYELIALGRVDEARRLADQAQPYAPESWGGEAEAQLLASDIAVCDGDLVKALAAAEAGREGFADLSNVLGECSAWNHVAAVASMLGRSDVALAASDAATRLSERIGVSHFQAWTASTRGFVSLRRGALDQALDDFSLSIALHERLASSGLSEPLFGLGDVHRERGERVQARSAYERALALAEENGNATARVLATAGLARLTADDSPAEAIVLADRAREAATTVPQRFEATVAKGWVLHDVGADGAAARAAEAEAIARATASPLLLARAIELSAMTEREPAQREALLQEALGIWRRLENQHAEAMLGIRLAPRVTTAPLAVETLGRFAVLRNGEAVTPAEWQSKKARDLLKILVTRRGQATPRDYLIELLWPADDPARTPKRLAVAVNVLRNVLDPQREHSTDHVVAGDKEGLRLELRHISVDVEDFLRHAQNALGGNDRELLEQAEAAYAGEFLAEDRYADWATPLRDEVHATYQELVRALAATTEEPRYLLRVLALDPYDEDSHLLLIRTYAGGGMHGEARRAYRRYVERMHELGLEPVAYEHAAKRD